MTVREAVIPDAYEEGYWDDDPKYGRRYLVKGTAEDVGPLLAMLDPVGDDVWRLLTAYPLG